MGLAFLEILRLPLLMRVGMGAGAGIAARRRGGEGDRRADEERGALEALAARAEKIERRLENLETIVTEKRP